MGVSTNAARSSERSCTENVEPARCAAARSAFASGEPPVTSKVVVCRWVRDEASTIRKPALSTAGVRVTVPTTRTLKSPACERMSRGRPPSRSATAGEARTGSTRSFDGSVPFLGAAPVAFSRSAGNGPKPVARVSFAYVPGSTPTSVVPFASSMPASLDGSGTPYSIWTGATSRTPPAFRTSRTSRSGSGIASPSPLIRASAPVARTAASSRASATPASTEPPNAAVVSATSSANRAGAPLTEARPARARARKPTAPRSRATVREASRSGSGYRRARTSAAISPTSTGAALTRKSVPPPAAVPRRRSAATAPTASTSTVSSATVRRRDGRAVIMSSRAPCSCGRR